MCWSFKNFGKQILRRDKFCNSSSTLENPSIQAKNEPLFRNQTACRQAEGKGGSTGDA